MPVRKRCGSWYYDFQIKGVRYRGLIPEARTKQQAEQAETHVRLEVFEGRYGKQLGTQSFSEFVERTYLPWARANKKSWKHDEFRARTLKEYFRGKTLAEISPLMIEKLKLDRRESNTRRGNRRSLASVNRELELLSRIFTMAVDCGAAETNPSAKVKKFVLDNMRYRYLLPEEEPRLMAALTGPRAHLRPFVIVALGTGLRLTEQLSLKWQLVDFSRGVITATKTKSGRDRDIPMNHDVREALSALRREANGSEYVFSNPHTGTRQKEVKRGFQTALRLAGIEGLRWHDLRATFGTRLGEAGYDAFTIAELMGHSDIHTTRRYVRATERNKRAAVEAAMLSAAEARHNGVANEKRPPRLAAANS